MGIDHSSTRMGRGALRRGPNALEQRPTRGICATLEPAIELAMPTMQRALTAVPDAAFLRETGS